MKIRTMFVLSLLALGSAAATARAMPRPYLGGSFGGGTLKMGAVNEVLESQEAAIRAGGYTDIKMKKVGAGSEWGFGGGFWLFPALRVGATWSQQHSFLSNRYHSPDHTYFYGEELTFDMAETGVEAAVRVPQFFGLSIGGSASRAKANFKLSDGEQTTYSYFGNDAKATKTGRTWAAFAGFEQTNDAGWTGALHAGYRWRNMGSMPIHGISNDGVNSAEWTGTTPEIDYSGVFVQCQIGYDVFHRHGKFGE